MEQYLGNFKKCIQKEEPACIAVCPFHLDVKDFIEKMKRGSYKAAYKTYRNAVGFPRIASALCSAPCKNACPGRETDRAIQLDLLEKACIEYTEDKRATDYNLPMKKKKVAIIGAGISGLACLLRLSVKKYEVEVFEATDRIGGALWNLMDSKIFMEEIEGQLAHEVYQLHLNRKIETVEQLDLYGFDAVFVATGKGGNGFGLEKTTCKRYGKAGWFLGGGILHDEPTEAMARGLAMGTIIDNFLKTNQLIYPQNEKKTKIQLDSKNLTFDEKLFPSDGAFYSKEEAEKEAARCISCQCDFCRSYCDLTTYYNKWPLRIRDEVLATTLPGTAEVKATPAKRLMSTCSQCGLCKETCPEEIDLGGLILEGRRSMHRQKKAPWAFHDFWLRDMVFANSPEAAICKNPHGEESSKYAFFPGCQLGASDPDLVEKTYEFLKMKEKRMGLLLRCCGAPAEWSGDEALHQNELDQIRKDWMELGKPIFILACPTCQKKFDEYLQDIPTISLYEVLELWKDDLVSLRQKEGESLRAHSVFDACAARHQPKVKTSVRSLAEGFGITLSPLPENDQVGRCCGYGGQPAIANPDYASYVTEKRIGESEDPYITYCINCRDAFRNAGKESIHILEILFQSQNEAKALATISQRRENRILLKNKLCRDHWEEPQMEMEEKPFEIVISNEVEQKLNKERILISDLATVIEFCERTGRKAYLSEEDGYSGYMQIGYMTYWVIYRMIKTGKVQILNGYAHRIKIELEAVWNGRKTDADV